MTTKIIHEANFPRWTWESPSGEYHHEIDHIIKWRPKPVINWGLFTSLVGFWDNAVVDNIDEEYDRLVQYFHDSAKKAEASRATNWRLSYETLKLIRPRGVARAACK
ncbi:hypothetical protein ANCCAN_00855 [Ancylostoma caninum]|uniref:Uncharacterized protein n=1 Tax=Ancylostoma caninum TaxID=29170 RepID=A0A368HBT3_ANCCA|nr:hypothetical protein ANCCAN_00855 [Ancylostoma caninum]